MLHEEEIIPYSLSSTSTLKVQFSSREMPVISKKCSIPFSLMDCLNLSSAEISLSFMNQVTFRGFESLMTSETVSLSVAQRSVSGDRILHGFSKDPLKYIQYDKYQ